MVAFFPETFSVYILERIVRTKQKFIRTIFDSIRYFYWTIIEKSNPPPKKKKKKIKNKSW